MVNNKSRKLVQDQDKLSLLRVDDGAIFFFFFLTNGKRKGFSLTRFRSVEKTGNDAFTLLYSPWTRFLRLNEYALKLTDFVETKPPVPSALVPPSWFPWTDQVYYASVSNEATCERASNISVSHTYTRAEKPPHAAHRAFERLRLANSRTVLSGKM